MEQILSKPGFKYFTTFIGTTPTADFVPIPSPNIDDDLLLQIINGDSAAFTCVYELYKDTIFAFAYSLTKSRETAEEIVQEVFFKLWEKRAQILIGQSFTAYLKKITYNHTIDFFRKVKRSTALQDTLQRNMETLNHSNEDALIGKDLELLYTKAIELLPPQKKRIYLLGKEGDLSYEEIADEMGLSKNTVRNHMSIAIQSVREYINRHYITGFIFLLVVLHWIK